MQLRGVDYGPIWAASGALGFFGEGYWFHTFGPSLDKLTFVAKTVTLEGNTIQIAHGNGVGEHIRWTAQVTDGSGNSSSASCETVIARK